MGIHYGGGKKDWIFYVLITYHSHLTRDWILYMYHGTFRGIALGIICSFNYGLPLGRYLSTGVMLKSEDASSKFSR